MAFDLFVTFAGMCLFKIKPDEPLLRVLLPGPVHNHHAIVGFHLKYAVQSTAHGNRFRERPLPRGGKLLLDRLVTDDTLEPNLDGYNVVNLTEVLGRPPEPDKAFCQVLLKHGSACPRALCEPADGAIWKLEGSAGGKPQHMATSVTWCVSNVQNELGRTGEEGLDLLLEVGGATQKLAELRPQGNQIRLYVFHTHACELPSGNPPCIQRLRKGHKVEHFRDYYKLFPGDPPDAAPVFVNDGSKRALPFAEARAFGRLFTCMVSQTNEG
jgi:hypothetical protein